MAAEAPVFSSSRIVRWSDCSEAEKEHFAKFFAENNVTVRGLAPAACLRASAASSTNERRRLLLRLSLRCCSAVQAPAPPVSRRAQSRAELS